MQISERSKKNHEVIKIGGTSMTNMAAVLSAIIFQAEYRPHVVNSFIVSAYGAGNPKEGIMIPIGVTDLLLEGKKNNEPGIYSHFVKGGDYREQIHNTLVELRRINSLYELFGLELKLANEFITEELDNTVVFLSQLKAGTYFPQQANQIARERLASIGEKHSAFNLSSILSNRGLSNEFVDLSGFDSSDNQILTIEERIKQKIASHNDSKIKIVTGYTGGVNGIMQNYDRGYSEVTAALYAIECGGPILTILKEFALSSADPKIVHNVVQILKADYRFANELAMIGMEAIHPKIARMLEDAGIDISVKNILNLHSPATVISSKKMEYEPSIQMVTGKDKVTIITLENPSMGSETNYLGRLCQVFSGYNVLSISSDANKITVIICTKEFGNKDLKDKLEGEFSSEDNNSLHYEDGSLIIAAGSNLNQKGIFARASKALGDRDINIISASQPSNPNSIQFAVDRSEYENGIRAIHREFVGTLN
jgi:aspartate kinase